MKDMCEVAVFAANKEDAATHGLTFNPLTLEARAILDKLLPAPEAIQGGCAIAPNLDNDLEKEV